MLEKVWNLLPEPPDGFADSIGFAAVRRPASVQPRASYRGRGGGVPEGRGTISRTTRSCCRTWTRRRHGSARRCCGTTRSEFSATSTRDGVSGTAIVVSALESLGLKVVPYLPHRVDEGHGLNIQAVETLAEQGVTLLVTVDNGINSGSEIAHAARHGIETIITDHHALPDDPPKATAIVNPRRGRLGLSV